MDRLPDEIKLVILMKVSGEDIFETIQISKGFYQLSDLKFWKAKALLDAKADPEFLDYIWEGLQLAPYKRYIKILALFRVPISHTHVYLSERDRLSLAYKLPENLVRKILPERDANTVLGILWQPQDKPYPAIKRRLQGLPVDTAHEWVLDTYLDILEDKWNDNICKFTGHETRWFIKLCYKYRKEIIFYKGTIVLGLSLPSIPELFTETIFHEKLNLYVRAGDIKEVIKICSKLEDIPRKALKCLKMDHLVEIINKTGPPLIHCYANNSDLPEVFKALKALGWTGYLKTRELTEIGELATNFLNNKNE